VNREFLVDRRGDAIHVLLTGEIDVAACPAVGRAIRRALGMPGGNVVVNLDAVTFIDSSGLGAIVAGYHDAASRHAGFTIGPPAVPAVARVLSTTGLRDALVLPRAVEDGTATGT
jgi:anti-sigma B factor antagonist